jgi:hypothetical protein
VKKKLGTNSFTVKGADPYAAAKCSSDAYAARRELADDGSASEFADLIAELDADIAAAKAAP